MPSGHYEILRPIGAGGMAELFLARTVGEDGLPRLVVLKRILPHLARDTSFIEMFLNEARIAATLQHPNVVAVTDFGQREGGYFIAMEYVHGADLAELLERVAMVDAPLPHDVALTIVQRSCAGLHHAHERLGFDGQPLELVHRDVSPQNVMVSYDGSIKVTDFGIATAAALTRTTRAGTLKGKVSYMAPEQCRGGRIDRRCDVFALGILLYETTLLTRLFVGDNDYALMNQVIEGRFTAPSDVDANYPPALETIVMRALAVDPDDRYGTALELQLAIESYAAANALPLSTNTVGAYVTQLLGPRVHPATELAAASMVGTRVAVAPRRRRGWILAAGAVGLAAVAITGVALARPEPTPVVEPTPATPAPEVVLVPTPVPVLPADFGDDPQSIVEPVEDALDPAIDEEEELIVIDEEGRTSGSSRTGKRKRGNNKTVRTTYDLDEAAPPR